MTDASDHRPILRRFAGQAGYALVLRVLWAAISFVSAALFARWFSARDYGNYAAVTSLVAFLSVVCGLGMPNAIVRLLGEAGGDHPTREQAGLAHGALRASHGAALIASVGAALLLAAGAVALHALNLAPEPWVYVAGAALLPAFTITDVQAAAARSYGRVFTALAPKDVIWRLLLIPLAWAITATLPLSRQLVTFMLIGAGALSVTSIGQAWLLRRAAPPLVWSEPPVYRLRYLASLSASTWITQICGAVFRSADVVIAGIFLPSLDVGLYFAASRVAALISFVLVSTNLIVGPEVAKLHYAGSHAHLTRVLKLAALLIFVPSLVAFVICVGFPNQVLSLFGHRFVAARTELIVLAAGQLVNATTGCVGIVLQMTGFERKNAEILVTSSIGTVVAMAVLTYFYGGVGTAVGMSAGVSISNLRMWLVARRRTAYDPSIMGLLRRAG